MSKLISHLSQMGRYGYTLPQTAIDEYSTDSIFENLKRSKPYSANGLNEYDIYEYFNSLNLKRENNVVNGADYTLSILDDVSKLDGFTGIHPYQLADAGQGAFELLFTLRHMLCDMLGVDMISLGQVTPKQSLMSIMLMIKSYFASKKESRNTVIAVEGVCPFAIKTLEDMGFDVVSSALSEIKNSLTTDVAAVFIRTPDDNGIFASNIIDITDIAHNAGALCVLDGKNLKALSGISRPGDMGFDCVMMALCDIFDIADKFADDASYLVGVKEDLVNFVPVPMVEIDDLEQHYFDYDRASSVGKPNEFYGNFTSWIKALGFILSQGYEGFVNNAKACKLNSEYAKLIKGTTSTINACIDKRRIDE